ncbi:hypothetical protein F5Y00DRAFT_247677 [Daldinia vernicosa]|uniref:uncharacterized protein n=1 Tax=Daldinia vernicosa TaxID=114800 RepID=UPI002008017A|nr:uncharacterized protein F5Y00DRAFT_247677 [Daldinia vernicosa]KAI0844895.1 hypothetical protein F5Y00DRAFT_247677 [Daldinia vernicosa]
MRLTDQSMTISVLSNELLLCIFDNLLPSTLLQCTLCCKRWSRLASPVLYKHIALTPSTFSKWTKNPSDSNDVLISTFTLYINLVRSRPDQKNDVFRQLYDDLLKLPSRLAKMANLKSFSLTTSYGAFANLWVPGRLVVPIIDHLPPTCICLEIDIMSSSCETYRGYYQEHLCHSIRRVLPQLQFLRLSYPRLCPEAFGYGFAIQPSWEKKHFQPIQMPRLEQCLIKAAQTNHAVSTVSRSTACYRSDVHAVTILTDYLAILKSSGNAPRLQKLWVIDALPSGHYYNALGAWVRRNILKGNSETLPSKSLIRNPTRKFYVEALFIRTPRDEGGQDLISTREGVQLLAEGYAWVQASNGARIPGPYISKRTHLEPVTPVMRTEIEWLALTNVSCNLWLYETTVGARLLDVAEGELTENRVPIIRLPEGWTLSYDGWTLSYDGRLHGP